MNNKKRKENDFIIVVKDIKTHCVIENKDIIIREALSVIIISSSSSSLNSIIKINSSNQRPFLSGH